jgi:hypothetical protein
MVSTLRLRLCLAALLLTLACAYTPSNPNSSPRGRSMYYMPPSSPTSTHPSTPVTAQTNKHKTVGAEQRGNNWRLSNSVLAGCDTLPAFRTAHGILSPETVSRMDDMTNGGHGNEAVSTFLKAYRQHGPMSCLEMLSDPEILPHLTKAMRDIAL